MEHKSYKIGKYSRFNSIYLVAANYKFPESSYKLLNKKQFFGTIRLNLKNYEKQNCINNLLNNQSLFGQKDRKNKNYCETFTLIGVYYFVYSLSYCFNVLY